MMNGIRTVEASIKEDSTLDYETKQFLQMLLYILILINLI